MKLFAMAILLAFQLPTGWTIQGPLEYANPMEDFKVEALSQPEIDQLQKAQLELNAAEGKYRNIMETVKQAHGQTSSGLMGCNTPVHSVQLRGHYALVSTDLSMSSCAVMAEVETGHSKKP